MVDNKTEPKDTDVKSVSTKNNATTSKKPMSAKNKKILIIVAIIAGIIIFLGMIGSYVAWHFISSKVTDKTAETLVEGALGSATGNKVDVNTKNGSVNVQGENGASASYGSDQKLSEDFPKEVSIYPNQTIKSNFRTKSADGEINWIISATSKDATATVSNYYKDKMASWTNQSSYEVNGSSTYNGEKDKLTVMISVSPDTGSTSDKTIITYSVLRKP